MGPARRGAGLPWMTLALSVLCLAASAYYAWLEPAQQRVVIGTVGANPARLAALLGGAADSGWNVLLLSLFFHSSVLHLVGNIVYLWVFGLPVERRMGPWPLALVFGLLSTRLIFEFAMLAFQANDHLARIADALSQAPGSFQSPENPK